MTKKPKPVIVRTRNAGVHFGYLSKQSADGTRCTLKKSRRCWRFYIDYKKHGTSQVSCSELAVYGPHGESLIAVCVEEIELIGVIEIIAATEAATKAIEEWRT